eukprot:TRINITY_DN16876_c0_g1_i3.p1 TRINITY_DN16876_c0_g1~~TRINITY_DN16876_c0_g1_i3.p1  ORF type:complete len:281 (-),score=32.99 TRINITY_DN16876_c0_g1_i3:67-873(-)
MELVLTVVRKALAFPFERLPHLLGTAFPRGAFLVSCVVMYNFVHTLALLWFFVMLILASVCTLSVAAVAGKGLDRQSLFEKTLDSVAAVYVTYAVVSVVVRFSINLWKVSWETYHDFPTMKHMLVGRKAEALCDVRVDAADAATDLGFSRQISSGTESASDGAPSPTACRTLQVKTTPHAVLRRSIVLLTPISLIFAANASLLAAQLFFCDQHSTSCRGPDMFNPTSRINRTLRFVLLLRCYNGCRRGLVCFRFGTDYFWSQDVIPIL